MIGDDEYCDRCDHYADDVNFLLKSKDECLCLCHVLNEEIEHQQILGIVFTRINRMCDKCNIVYTEHTMICRCGNDRLRTFRIRNNLKELEKNFKENESLFIKLAWRKKKK